MKTAIYIDSGIHQIVLTPESDFEKELLKDIKDKKLSAKIMHGEFYECLGGWVRVGYGASTESLLVRFDDNVKEESPS